MTWCRYLVAGLAGSAITMLLIKLNQQLRHCPKPSIEKIPLSEAIFFPGPNLGLAPLSDDQTRDFNDLSESLKRLIMHVNSARQSLDLCLFLITSRPLADAVLNRLSRGVRVRLLIDDSSVDVSGSQVSRFRREGAFVRSKASAYLMHHKFCLVDGKKLINGSLNWTMQGLMGNKENLIVTDHSGLVQAFQQQFEELWTEMTN